MSRARAGAAGRGRDGDAMMNFTVTLPDGRAVEVSGEIHQDHDVGLGMWFELDSCVLEGTDGPQLELSASDDEYVSAAAIERAWDWEP